MINPFDREYVRSRVANSIPFRHCVLDNFLDPGFAQDVHDAFPSYRDALRIGRVFHGLSEKGKVQITDTRKFPPPVHELNRILASPAWIQDLSIIFNMPD